MHLLVVAEMVTIEHSVDTMELRFVGVVVRDMGEMIRILNFIFADERDNGAAHVVLIATRTLLTPRALLPSQHGDGLSLNPEHSRAALRAYGIGINESCLGHATVDLLVNGASD